MKQLKDRIGMVSHGNGHIDVLLDGEPVHTTRDRFEANLFRARLLIGGHDYPKDKHKPTLQEFLIYATISTRLGNALSRGRDMWEYLEDVKPEILHKFKSVGPKTVYEFINERINYLSNLDH